MKKIFLAALFLILNIASASAGSLQWNNVSAGNSVEVPLSTVEPESLTVTAREAASTGTWCLPIIGCLSGRGNYSVQLALESSAGSNDACTVSNTIPSTNCAVETKLGGQEFQVVLAPDSTEQNIRLSAHPRNLALFRRDYSVNAEENPSCVLEESGSCKPTGAPAPAPSPQPSPPTPREEPTPAPKPQPATQPTQRILPTPPQRGTLQWVNVKLDRIQKPLVSFPPTGMAQSNRLALRVESVQGTSVKVSVLLDGAEQSCGTGGLLGSVFGSKTMDLTAIGEPESCGSAQHPMARDLSIQVQKAGASNGSVDLLVSSSALMGGYVADYSQNPECELIEFSKQCHPAPPAPEAEERKLPEKPQAEEPATFKTTSGETKSVGSLRWDIPLGQDRLYSITLPEVNGKRLMVSADKALYCAPPFVPTACGTEPEKKMRVELSFQWAGEEKPSHCSIALTGEGDMDASTCMKFIQSAQIESYHPATIQARVRIDSEFIRQSMYVNASQQPECDLGSEKGCPSTPSTEPAPRRELEPMQQQPGQPGELGTLVWKNVSREAIGNSVEETSTKAVKWKFTLKDIRFCSGMLCLTPSKEPIVELGVEVDGKAQDCDPGFFSGTSLTASGLNKPATCSSAESAGAKDTTLAVTRYNPSDSSADLTITGSVISGNRLYDQKTGKWCELDLKTEKCKEGAGVESTPTEQEKTSQQKPAVAPEKASFNTGFPALDAEAVRQFESIANKAVCASALERSIRLERGDEKEVQTKDWTSSAPKASSTFLWEKFDLDETSFGNYYFSSYPLEEGEPYGWIDLGFVRGIIAWQSHYWVFLRTSFKDEEAIGLMQILGTTNQIADFDPASNHPYFSDAGITQPISGEERYNPKHNIAIGEDIIAEGLEKSKECVLRDSKANVSDRAQAFAAFYYQYGEVPKNCAIPEPKKNLIKPGSGDKVSKALAWSKVFDTYYEKAKQRIDSNPGQSFGEKTCVELFGGPAKPSPSPSVSAPATTTVGKPTRFGMEGLEEGKTTKLETRPRSADGATPPPSSGTRVRISGIPSSEAGLTDEEKKDIWSIYYIKEKKPWEGPADQPIRIRVPPFRLEVDASTLESTAKIEKDKSCRDPSEPSKWNKGQACIEACVWNYDIYGFPPEKADEDCATLCTDPLTPSDEPCEEGATEEAPSIEMTPTEAGEIKAKVSETKKEPEAAGEEPAAPTPEPSDKVLDERTVTVLEACNTILDCLKNLDKKFVLEIFEQR